MESKPKAEILTIGAELLKGSTLNTNAQYLGRELTRLGFRVHAQVSCDDVVAEIKKSLAEALERSDLVILTGGLGPTPDDVTRDCLAEFFKVPLVFSKKQYAHIVRYYRTYQRPVPALVRKEACFPQNAVPLINRHGIALGFYHAWNDRLIVVLPGVPVELRKMYEDLVLPLVRAYFKKIPRHTSLVVKTVGLSEPTVMARLGNGFFREPFEFGIYPYPGEATVRIDAAKAATVRRCRAVIRKKIGDSVYAFEDVSLAGAVGKLLSKKRQTLAVAESCTGGLLAAAMTAVPGASRYFTGGVCAYGNAVKEDLLGVSGGLLKRGGAVSAAVARAMARGVRSRLRTTYGIGVTGIAGPSGAGTRKAVGLVFIALAAPRGCRAWRHYFLGDRGQIQNKAATKALEHLWRAVR